MQGDREIPVDLYYGVIPVTNNGILRGRYGRVMKYRIEEKSKWH